MERKIGEIFEYNGEWYQVVEGYHCYDCDFRHENGSCIIDANYPESKIGNCNGDYRPDNQNVVFKKLEKVGEPFTISGTLYQHYKVFDIDNVCGDGFWCVHNYNAKTLTIEIKQNKKEMVNKKTNFVEEIDALCKRYNMAEGVRADFMAEVKEIIKDENRGCKLKPFDLEAAKLGKPVCTRDGRKVRIICFDRDWDMHIVALVSDPLGESVHYYLSNGKVDFDKQNDEDLMMLPEKKEGWVNIDKGGSGKITISSPYSTKEEAIHNDNETTIDTIKIYWEE